METVAQKTVFITGAAQGLGKGYVQRFLEEGANVFFGDVNATVGKTTEQELQCKYGEDRVTFCQFDVTDGAKFKDAVDQAISRLGHIDIFINNAGVLNEGIWEKMIDINVTSLVRGTQLALEHMRKDKGGRGGRIVSISSFIGLHEHFTMPVYCASKHAVRAYTTSIAMTPNLTSEMGIEIASLCPDAARTDMMTGLNDNKIYGYTQLKPIIDSRMIGVTEVVDAMFSLLHRKDMNGAILLVTAAGCSFQKMEKKDLGPEWPIPEKAT